MNFLQMLKILEKMPKPSPVQLRQAAAMLARSGYRVEAPSERTTWNRGKITAGYPGVKKPKPYLGQQTPLPLTFGVPAQTEQVEQRRDTSQDGLLQGEMQLVVSSNVHSIGMRIDNAGDSKGTLLVRFLGQHAGGVRAGIGSLYAYMGVPVNVFRAFQRAASKGGFVWDELRVRGTIAGHRYEYQLVGVAGAFVASLGRHVESYVPRQAALKRGEGGQHFIKRTFGVGEIRGGRMQTRRVESQLAPSMASTRGPNPARGPGANALRFLPGNVTRH